MMAAGLLGRLVGYGWRSRFLRLTTATSGMGASSALISAWGSGLGGGACALTSSFMRFSWLTKPFI